MFAIDQVMNMKIEKSDSPFTLAQRSTYLDSLVEPQELYLEMLIALGVHWSIGENGYAITNQYDLVEFYLPNVSSQQLTDAISQLKKTTGIQFILYKSFDQQLAEVAGYQNSQPETVGYLFREFQQPAFVSTKIDVTLRSSTAEDLQSVAEINDDFFEGMQEIEMYHRNNALFCLTEETGALVGCGITTRGIPGRRDVGLGMLVAKEKREQGLGAYIINSLASNVISNGDRPICGCSSDNQASFAALQKAGFTSHHQNLRVKLD